MSSSSTPPRRAGSTSGSRWPGRSLARDGQCRWADAPREVIAAETARQGRLYAESVLAAPLICRA